MEKSVASLEIANLSVNYGNRSLFTNISSSANTGQLICLMGPNGSGKSTLLRCLAGLQKAPAGTVSVKGQEISNLSLNQIASHISIVLTQKAEVENLTVKELIALGRQPYTSWTGRLLAGDKEKVQEALVLCELLELAHKDINLLSDGERQRTMIAMALAQDCDIMLLDEPSAFLDISHKIKLMQLLQNLAHHKNKLIILSTHDLDLALKVSDRVWLLSKTGTFIDTKSTELINSPVLENVFGAEIKTLFS